MLCQMLGAGWRHVLQKIRITSSNDWPEIKDSGCKYDGGGQDTVGILNNSSLNVASKSMIGTSSSCTGFSSPGSAGDSSSDSSSPSSPGSAGASSPGSSGAGVAEHLVLVLRVQVAQAQAPKPRSLILGVAGSTVRRLLFSWF